MPNVFPLPSLCEWVGGCIQEQAKRHYVHVSDSARQRMGKSVVLGVLNLFTIDLASQEIDRRSSREHVHPSLREPFVGQGPDSSLQRWFGPTDALLNAECALLLLPGFCHHHASSTSASLQKSPSGRTGCSPCVVAPGEARLLSTHLQKAAS